MRRWRKINSIIPGQIVALVCLVFLISGCGMFGKSVATKKPARLSVDTPAPTRVAEEAPKPPPKAIQQPAPVPKAETERPAAATAPAAAQPAPSEEKKAPRAAPRAVPEPEMISLNLEDADLQSVLRALGKLAGINFVVAQGVKAQVTMKIDRIPATKAFSVIEAILEANNLAAVKSGDLYKIVPVAAAQQQPGYIGMGMDLTQEMGFFTQIIPLQYLSVDGLVNILQPLVSQGRVIGHRETNTIILSGPAAVIREVVKTLKALDVQGQQREAQRIYIYYVNNARASELAGTLMTVFTEEKLGKKPISVERLPFSPGVGGPPPPPPPKPGVSYREGEAAPDMATQAGLQPERAAGEVRIVSDDRTNSLIIKATARDYEFLEPIIKKLDITPKQVVIEALVAEVTLTDSFASSVEQFLRVGEFALQSSFGVAGPLRRPVFFNSEGFTLTFVDRERFSLFLNLVALQTKVNTVATPHILTQDNKRARIQIGQEVPLITGTQATITGVSGGGENLFQTLQRRDIGRILSIIPHVNEERQVTLDIELEASDQSGVGDGNSTIFNKRSVQTSVVVEDGQSLLIGGIISENKSRTVNEIPFLGRLPVIGQFFRTTSEAADKTELIILLTPRVIANPEEGRQLTEEFKRRLNKLEQHLRAIP